MIGKSPYKNLYPKQGKELNLREEFNKTLYGDFDEIAKGRTGLLRKMRRNEEGDLIRCSCRDIVTDEPSSDYHCRYCKGHGYYWDEIPIVYFYNKNNDVDDIFYLEYNIEVTDRDYIVQVKLDNNGNIIIPVQRERFFRIREVDIEVADFSKIEFTVVKTVEERKWSTWYGVKNRQQ